MAGEPRRLYVSARSVDRLHIPMLTINLLQALLGLTFISSDRILQKGVAPRPERVVTRHAPARPSLNPDAACRT